MKAINFTKMVASGNDFLIIPAKGIRLPAGGFKVLAREICHRKYGIGADGLLILEKSKVANIKMRIFNADGSEAEMCANGVRCVSLYLGRTESTIESQAGIIDSRMNKNNVRIKLTDPKGIKLNIPVKINNRILKVNLINTGVPHTVIFVDGLDRIDVANLGRQIRYHRKFATKGTNVDFVEVLNNNSINVRTYERGVEDETLACGTGSVAAALIFALKAGASGNINPSTLHAKVRSSLRIDTESGVFFPSPKGRGFTSTSLSVLRRSVLSLPKENAAECINVHTRGKEILKVYFNRETPAFRDVWLEGRSKIICRGVCYVK